MIRRQAAAGAPLVAAALMLATPEASAALVEAARACLKALAPQVHAWSAPEPQALAVRLEEDRQDIVCRVSAGSRDDPAVPILYQVILDASHLRPRAIRWRRAGGPWRDL